MYRFKVILILGLASGSSSCWFHKSKPVRVFVPPATLPKTQPPVVTEVPVVPPAPEVQVSASPEAPQVPNDDTLPAAGPPPPAPRRPTPPPRAVVPAQPPSPAPEPTPAPRLETLLTAEQLREYNHSIDESLERVKRVLGSVAGRNLNAELTSIRDRIQTFQKQAEQARESDLVTAVNLARRADLLAQDLIKRLP